MGTQERNQMPNGKGKQHTPEQIVAFLRRAESGETKAYVATAFLGHGTVNPKPKET